MRQAMMFSKRGTSSAEVTAAIAAAQGGAQFDFVESYSGATFGQNAGTVTANTAYLAAFRVGRALTLSSISIYVGAAAGNADVGIYQLSGSTWTRIASSGSTAIAGTNAIQTIAFTASVTLQPGVTYALAFATDSATATVSRLAVTTIMAGLGNKLQSKATSFPLPTSLTSMSATFTNVFMYAA